MKAIDDRIGFRGFLARIFISNSGVSSRRVGGFLCLVSCLFLIFFQYPIEYVRIISMLTIGFFGLTTASAIFKPSSSEEENSVNNNNREL